MKNSYVASSMLLAVLVVLAMSISFAVANPIKGPDIWITSPLNEGVYNSHDLWLSFYPSVHLDLNYSYSIDGEPRIDIKENLTLSGLSSGSHTLMVYGVDTSGRIYTSWPVHFAVFYATSWILPAILLICIILAVVCLLFLAAFKTSLFAGKKTGGFWLGVVWLGFFSALALIFLWRAIIVELNFQYPEMRAPILSWVVMVVCLSIGVVLMANGLKKNNKQN